MPQRKLRPAAERDIDEAVFYLTDEGGVELSHRFAHELEVTFKRLYSLPHLGKLWPAEMQKLEGMRSLPLPRFPYSIFYLSTDGVIEIVRVLHQRREIEPLLEE